MKASGEKGFYNLLATTIVCALICLIWIGAGEEAIHRVRIKRLLADSNQQANDRIYRSLTVTASANSQDRGLSCRDGACFRSQALSENLEKSAIQEGSVTLLNSTAWPEKFINCPEYTLPDIDQFEPYSVYTCRDKNINNQNLEAVQGNLDLSSLISPSSKLPKTPTIFATGSVRIASLKLSRDVIIIAGGDILIEHVQALTSLPPSLTLTSLKGRVSLQVVSSPIKLRVFSRKQAEVPVEFLAPSSLAMPDLVAKVVLSLYR